MILRGFDAIEFAEKESLPLNKDEDPIDPPRTNLTIAEAQAIAADRPEVIWVEVDDAEYFGERHNMEPER